MKCYTASMKKVSAKTTAKTSAIWKLVAAKNGTGIAGASGADSSSSKTPMMRGRAPGQANARPFKPNGKKPINRPK